MSSPSDTTLNPPEGDLDMPSEPHKATQSMFTLSDDSIFQAALAVISLVHMYQNRRQRGPLLETATTLGLVKPGDADTYNSGVKPGKDSPEEAAIGRVNDLYAALASVPKWRD